jgi:hypothetical protein
MDQELNVDMSKITVEEYLRLQCNKQVKNESIHSLIQQIERIEKHTEELVQNLKRVAEEKKKEFLKLNMQ